MRSIIVGTARRIDHGKTSLVRAQLVADSFLEGAPVVAVSARTGAGIAELKAALRELAARAPAQIFG
ncbi:MAG: hypothetical protein LC802_22605 [Acidobacteria bacterium]|nr:hypothetical protein [Acidobacteriota bacterium]